MNLRALLLAIHSDLPELPEIIIHGLSSDSRTLNKGELYLALFSKRHHSVHPDYIQQAILQGVAAILLETTTEGRVKLDVQQGVPVISIPFLSKWVGKLAAAFYQHPAKSFPIMGVTGTSGKTSSVYFLASILTQLGYRVGSIGTLGAGFFGQLKETGYTTPDALQLQTLLFDFQQQKIDVAVMEVSSHSIEEERIQTVPFSMGGFTNLSQDHLDFHGDMETYAMVKARFFLSEFTQQAVINTDDETGRRYVQLLANLATRKPLCIYGLQPLPIYSYPFHYVQGKIRSSQADSFVLSVDTTWGSGTVTVPLCGSLFQASNILLVIAMLAQFGIPLQSILEALPFLQSVPGRMQVVSPGRKPVVIVDYSHKPDALEKALASLRPQCRGQLWCVFGCGGNRDALKRPLMADVAERGADVVVVTSDNPRHETPEAIMADIQTGFSDASRVTFIVDRGEAIAYAMAHLAEDDVLLVAGKGAETYQQVKDEKIPYSDEEWVRKTQDLTGMITKTY